MSGAREAMRQVPLATPFGRLVHERGGIRGVILSAAAHLALVLALLYGGTRLAVDDRMPGSGPGKGGGGGGGGGARALLLFAPPAAEAAAPAPPQPEPPRLAIPRAAPVPLPDVKPPDLPAPNLSAAQLLAALGPGAGPGKGTGAGPGAGSGSGGGTGSGRGPGTGPDSGGAGGDHYPPTPKQIILPPMDRPASVRGDTISVLFEISERGVVMRVSYSPPLRDRSYASEFTDKMKRYTFNPATTRDGHPIAAVYRIKIVL